MMEPEEIIRLIQQALPDARVEIEDMRGEGEHYAVYVQSEAFAGRTRVQQHQMVFSALQGRVGSLLRTLSLTTALPPELPEQQKE